MNLSDINDIAGIAPGIVQEQLDDLQGQFGRVLPEEYADLLRSANGLALKNGLMIYSSDEVFERNETFEVGKYAPGYLAIGDDSGGRSVLIRFEGNGVYVVDQGSMDPDDMQPIGRTLTEWISNGCPVHAI